MTVRYETEYMPAKACYLNCATIATTYNSFRQEAIYTAEYNIRSMDIKSARRLREGLRKYFFNKFPKTREIRMRKLKKK